VVTYLLNPQELREKVNPYSYFSVAEDFHAIISSYEQTGNGAFT
jgi:hypothetical protein